MLTLRSSAIGPCACSPQCKSHLVYRSPVYSPSVLLCLPIHCVQPALLYNPPVYAPPPLGSSVPPVQPHCVQPRVWISQCTAPVLWMLISTNEQGIRCTITRLTDHLRMEMLQTGLGDLFWCPMWTKNENQSSGEHGVNGLGMSGFTSGGGGGVNRAPQKLGGGGGGREKGSIGRHH